ncbi:DUF2752 domain-containing protein [Propionicimonas sp.]|uniref:DUF2752 domain-containing protein n=1 Tax=Propionicimonas sp. TaxID=1955623 RepID=UPI00179B2DAD|nr:DUF2752 domain-containing protein [Propionicimonas sp.]MBU3976715.1 DUF2752 domain-containing protein [Actinomycetota bacterium]MBA3019780.1 DUF2752 domain-containing protein [Propionicimonas sp.]MBU3986810.1 DUF2752 domain-containing protein [Actinomycetota bacterium]MBU4006722.1 DUF2752 domain-containing protein [Actinomycetota bacterium]MBU4065422.1 DUF2752 domain-containing protein [Actinomycetota bacterium]
MSAPATPAITQARRRLKSLGTLGLVGLGLSATFRFTGVGLPCPWRALTGTLCPFCGSTTMGVHLLDLDLAGAWAANPFVFSVGVGVGVAAVFWVVEAVGGPRVRLPRWLIDQRVWMSALGVIALTFTICRNL